MSLLDSASLICTPNAYKEGTLYSVIPSDGSGDLSVTRATTATRVNSAGLVELVPYNLLSWSEDFSSADWTKSNVTISANSTTAPNGTLSADTLTASGGTALHTCFWPTAQFGANHTISVYAKKNTNNFLQIYTDFVNTDYANFDLNNGVVGSVGSTVVSSSIENVGNGWYRCSFVTGASASKYVNFSIISSATSPRTESNALTTSVFIWGAQLNEGALKDYQKTETRLNIPRLDYSNGTCPSLLVEPQRTNLLTYSSSFDNAAWDKLNGGTSTIPVVTANYADSPDGTQNADRIQCSADTSSASNYSLVGPSINTTLSATGTFTIYLKSNTSSNQNVLIYWSAGQGQVFSVTPEWQRFTLSNLTAGTAGIRFGTRGGTGNFYSGGDATLDILAYGAQIEVGSYSTSYIPTTSASVTRNADVISKTGISSLIGQTEGTLFYDGFYGNEINEVYLFLQKEISTGVDDSIYIQQTAARIALNVYFGSTQQVFIADGAFATGQRIKIAASYKNNDFVLYVNGVQIGADNSGSVPTCGALQFASYRGTPTTSNFIANKGCKIYALWKTRLSNSELATLTTI